MKYIARTLLLILFFLFNFQKSVLLADNNQLITQMKVVNNDSTFLNSYMYDDAGNKVVETQYFQQGSLWIRNSLKEWIYNGDNCITQRERVWKNGDWVITYTIDFQYDNSKLVSEIHSVYSNGIANLLKKVNYEYSLNSITSKKEYAWNSADWLLSIETDFSYLSNGKADSILISNFDSGNLINQQLLSLTYNVDGTLSTQLLQQKVGSTWTNSLLTNWYYDIVTQQLQTQKNKIWNATISNWEYYQRTDYEYNNTNDLISESYQHWKTMFWENDTRYDYSYDSNHRLIKKTLSQPIYTTWRGIVSINYSDFTQNAANNIQSQFEFWGGNTGDLTTSFIPFLFNSSASVLKAESIQLSYVAIDNSIDGTSNIKNSNSFIHVYPNPSFGMFYINAPGFSLKSWVVSDLNGKILKKNNQTLQSGVVDITDLSKGIYMLKITTSNNQFIQKLLKE